MGFGRMTINLSGRIDSYQNATERIVIDLL